MRGKLPSGLMDPQDAPALGLPQQHRMHGRAEVLSYTCDPLTKSCKAPALLLAGADSPGGEEDRHDAGAAIGCCQLFWTWGSFATCISKDNIISFQRASAPLTPPCCGDTQVHGMV